VNTILDTNKKEVQKYFEGEFITKLLYKESIEKSEKKLILKSKE